jgi:hypothetical protein
VPPYTYLWSPGGATTDTIKNICNGHYCCTVTDNTGCNGATCVNVATGMSNIGANTYTIHVYPNPTYGILTVEGTELGQIAEIYNDMGQKLSSKPLNSSILRIDISQQPQGIYLLRVINGDATVAYLKKVIKW